MKKRIALVYGDPAGAGPDRVALFLKEHHSKFTPVIAGNEPVYTASLSRIAPDLIDQFPVYTVPIGKVIRGEPNRESASTLIASLYIAGELAAHRRVDAIAVTSADYAALSQIDPSIRDGAGLLSHVFPDVAFSPSFFLVSRGVTLYRGLSVPVLFDSADAEPQLAGKNQADPQSLCDLLTVIETQL